MLAILGAVLLASSVGVTSGSAVDPETSSGDTFTAWVPARWVQTAQADFQAGVLSQIDITSSPGDIKLGTTSSNETDSFNDGTKIASQSNVAIVGGQAKLTTTSASETLRPSGVGSLTQIAYTEPSSQPHWSMVDEAVPDDDSTQVWDVAQAYRTDLYAMPDMAPTGTINKVTVHIRAKGADIASYHALAKEAVRTHGTDYFGAENILTTTWTNYSYEWTTNPYTGSPWTSDEINALEAGVSLGYQNTGHYSRCTQVYVVVDYASYSSSGTLTSTNLLSGQSVVSVNSFSYNASAVPSSTTLRIQFSQDGSLWYNSAGTPGVWDTLSQGTNSIALSALGWSGANFYYRAEFTSDGTGTPVLDEIRIDYSNYFSSGTIASQVLDTGANGTTWNTLFWDEALPSSTDITFEVRASNSQFLKDAATSSWMSVGGTSPVDSGLPSGRYMQWRATLSTLEPYKTPILQEARVFHH